MFSSGNEVGTLAVWVGWVGEGGRVVGTERACVEGRGRLGGWPAVHHHHHLFFDRDGSTAVCPPLPSQRGAPRSMMSTRLRTRKTGRGVADGAEILVPISILRMSTNLNTTGTEEVPVQLLRLGAFPKYFSQPRTDARPPTTTTPCPVGALGRGCIRRGRESDAGQWAQQLKSSLGTRDVAGLLSAHWPPVTDRIACRRPAASIGPFGSSWLAILALRNPGLLRIMSKKQALQTRGSCRREEGKRGERGDQRSDSLAIQKVCRASLGVGWKKLRVCEPVRQCIRGPKEFEPNKMLTPFRTDEVEQSERDLTVMSSLGSGKKRCSDAGCWKNATQNPVNGEGKVPCNPPPATAAGRAGVHFSGQLPSLAKLASFPHVPELVCFWLVSWRALTS